MVFMAHLGTHRADSNTIHHLARVTVVPINIKDQHHLPAKLYHSGTGQHQGLTSPAS